jgi:hypothetical protein
MSGKALQKVLIADKVRRHIKKKKKSDWIGMKGSRFIQIVFGANRHSISR